MPGLLRGVARAAAISGTATAVSNRVSRRQANRWAEQASPPSAPPPAPPPEAYAPAGPAPSDMIQQLKDLAALRDQGVLTEEEFAQQKAQILGR
jgi:hypothetical protein